LPVFVKDIPNVFCIFNRSLSDGHGVATVISLNSDTFDSFSLDVGQEWGQAKIETLEKDGQWKTANTEFENRSVTVKKELSLMSPVILKFTV